MPFPRISRSQSAGSLIGSNIDIAVSTYTGQAFLRCVLRPTARSNSTKPLLRYNQVCIQHFSTQSSLRSALPVPGYGTLLPGKQARSTVPDKPKPFTVLSEIPRSKTPPRSTRGGKTATKLSGDPLDEWPSVDDLPEDIRPSRDRSYGVFKAPLIDIRRHSFPTFVKSRLPASIFSPAWGKWTWKEIYSGVSSPSDFSLKPGARIRLVTWNLDRRLPGYATRVAKALEEIWRKFGREPEPLVIMLQEMDRAALEAIEKLEFVRENFYQSRKEGELLTASRSKLHAGLWVPAGSHCLTLTSKILPRPRISIVQYGSWQFYAKWAATKHAVVADFPVYPSRILRLVNTHLTFGDDETGMSQYVRFRQLHEISVLLNGTARHRYNPVVAGVVGGDMNFKYLDDMLDCLGKITPVFKDSYFGGGSGLVRRLRHGFVDSLAKPDRFLYTGHIKTPGQEPGFGGLGTGLNVDCAAWELTKSAPKMPPHYIDDGIFERHGHSLQPIKYPNAVGFYSLPAYRTYLTTPVSIRSARSAVFELGNYPGGARAGSSKRKLRANKKEKTS